MMLETADPRAALDDPDVAVRAAAARDLARIGDLGDVALLLDRAILDRSPSVRLYTAAATAAVLRRARRSGPLKRSVADQVLDALRRFDPQGNPSVLLAIGAVGPAVRGRLGRLLKDPHSDVRRAAVAALRAEALSPLSIGDKGLEKDLAKWASGSLPMEAKLDLGRLLGEAGHPDGEALLLQLSAVVRDAEGVLGEARRRIAARRDRGAYGGVWRRQEPEVLSPPDDEADVPWVGLTAEEWFAEGSRTPLKWRNDGIPVGPEGPARLLFVGTPGQETHAALQTAEATRFACVARPLAAWVERCIDELRGVEPLCRTLVTRLGEGDAPVPPKVRTLLRWRGGDGAGAGEELDAALSGKKPKPELYWWRANVALSEGDLDLAREHLERYLAKAPKKDRFRAAADRLRGSLNP